LHAERRGRRAGGHLPSGRSKKPRRSQLEPNNPPGQRKVRTSSGDIIRSGWFLIRGISRHLDERGGERRRIAHARAHGRRCNNFTRVDVEPVDPYLVISLSRSDSSCK
jgi:hypothetical protein